MKKCKNCHKLKVESAFYIASSYTKDDGEISYYYASFCKKCSNIRSVEWHTKNILKSKKIKHRSYLKNIESSRVNSRRYARSHKEKIRKYMLHRRHTNPNVRIHASMTSMIKDSIKERKDGRKWESLVGYSRQQLMSHLEALFLPGMTWDNYGKYGWHIDHIKPRHAFKFSKYSDVEFKNCWSLKNLQPLWWQDNLHKGGKYYEEMSLDSGCTE